MHKTVTPKVPKLLQTAPTKFRTSSKKCLKKSVQNRSEAVPKEFRTKYKTCPIMFLDFLKSNVYSFPEGLGNC